MSDGETLLYKVHNVLYNSRRQDEGNCISIKKISGKVGKE